MPMIDVYAAAGTFGDTHSLARNLAAELMMIEEVPDILADCQSAGNPARYPSPAPANRLPEPIHVESSVNTRTGAGSDRLATMKSSLVGGAAARVRQMPITASARR